MKKPQIQLTVQSRLAQIAKDRLKAAEMLAKVKGMFITRQEVDFVLPVVIGDAFSASANAAGECAGGASDASDAKRFVLRAVAIAVFRHVERKCFGDDDDL